MFLMLLIIKNACISKHLLHTANEHYLLLDLSVEKKMGKYYQFIQNVMHFRNVRDLVKKCVKI